ncbi:MAG: hypothetical protein ACI9RU_002354 [Litorivivens sp.]|jgi:hypothetical protein
MKKLILAFTIILSSFASHATLHIVNVWDGYFQFVDELNFSPDITIQLGDTVQWLPLDVPAMIHTITSTNIPSGAETFDQIWQAPGDTFFQYVPQIVGLYEYVCTPHEKSHGMVGSINVIGVVTEISDDLITESAFLIYPNPTAELIHFNSSNFDCPYKVFTLNGKILMSGTTKDIVNVSALSNGLYYIEIISDKRRIMKFTKQDR